MIFKSKRTEVKVIFNMKKIPTSTRNILVKNLLNFFEECEKEHKGVHFTLTLLMHIQKSLRRKHYRKDITTLNVENIISYENVGTSTYH